MEDICKIETFNKEIINWFEKNGENFPWRNTSDPWAILFAAVLLRKTTVKQVEKIFPDLIKEFPNSKKIQKTSVEVIENRIKTLGLEKKRSQELKKMSEIINSLYNGKVPDSEEKLITLPGIGKYISNEVLLSAYKIPKPLLDSNMIRVIERVFNYKMETKRARTDQKLWKFAETLVPNDPIEARKYNYGVLDFAESYVDIKARFVNCAPFLKSAYIIKIAKL